MLPLQGCGDDSMKKQTNRMSGNNPPTNAKAAEPPAPAGDLKGATSKVHEKHVHFMPVAARSRSSDAAHTLSKRTRWQEPFRRVTQNPTTAPLCSAHWPEQ